LVRVAISNASGDRAAAPRASDLIGSHGFTAFQTGSGRSRNRTAITFRKAVHERYAREIATLLGGAEVEKDPGDPRADWRPEIRVVLAPDALPALAPGVRSETF
jgi:hypothetical protein